jgi:nicotinamidase-related amidase
MSDRIWDRFLTPSDKAHLAASAPKVPYGFGRRAAVLSVDNYRGAVGDRPEPLLQAIRTWPSSAGQEAWEALDRIAELLAAARAVGVPVIHVTGLAAEESGMPGWSARRGPRGTTDRDAAARDRHRRRYDIVDQAAPLPGEVVLKKTAPSAFFGTPLAAHLISEGIDTLIVCGEAVSGCVRATVIDGCSYRLNMIVVEECVYDRHEATRAINLFDIDQKYGDVISLAETLAWLRRQGSQAARGQDDQHHPVRHRHDHDHPDAGVMTIPREVLAALPAGAVPMSSASQAISGHVLAKAGSEIIDAVTAQMASAFGDVPHVVVPLRAEQVTDRPELHEAIAQTDGGVFVVGVGYQLPVGSPSPASGPSMAVPSAADPPREPCPECGTPADETVYEPRPDGSSTALLVCGECGAAWEI